MINSAFNRGQKKAVTPIKVVGPFPMKIGANKDLFYGFGRMKLISPKVTPMVPKIKSSLNFGRLGAIEAPLQRPPALGVGRPISISSMVGGTSKSVGGGL